MMAPCLPIPFEAGYHQCDGLAIRTTSAAVRAKQRRCQYFRSFLATFEPAGNPFAISQYSRKCV